MSVELELCIFLQATAVSFYHLELYTICHTTCNYDLLYFIPTPVQVK